MAFYFYLKDFLSDLFLPDSDMLLAFCHLPALS